jgi:hypothetical protein
MKDDELEELQNREEWDFEDGERRPGAKSTRAVVSVAFAREDFERVSACAEQSRKRTSQFIREAALEKVSRYERPAVLAAFSGSLGAALFTPTPPPTTRVSGSSAQLASKGVTA